MYIKNHHLHFHIVICMSILPILYICVPLARLMRLKVRESDGFPGVMCGCETQHVAGNQTQVLYKSNKCS